MLLVNVGKRTFGLAFSHPKVTEHHRKNYPRRWTHCQIFAVEPSLAGGALRFTLLAEGSTGCSVKDNFCKATGRKLALTYALQKAGSNLYKIFNKADRAAIWEGYLCRAEAPTVPDPDFTHDIGGNLMEGL